MDALILARIQFATTTVFHFFFVPLTIGLAFIVAIMQTMYVVKKKEIYKDMAKFWGKFFLINFAVGVVTGIIQEFQFGMNWSEYSRFVGDIFGPPLAVEALLAFFMESTFIGFWIFGWDKLGKKLHLASIWLVSIGTSLSALWILAANSFMQNPVGYQMVGTRAEMTSIAEVLTNPKVLVAFPHTIFASFTTGAFMILGISAIGLMKKKNVEFYKKSMTIPLIVGLISVIGVALTGHSQGSVLVETQPMKMAAAEGVYEDTGDVAPWSLVALIDTENKEVKSIDIPALGSLMYYGKMEGKIEGMNSLQDKYVEQYGEGNYIPPVKTTYWTFRIMVGFGALMILLALIGAVKQMRGTMEKSKGYFKWLAAAIAFPYIANTSGWIMSEIGRQPWIVDGLLKTEAAVSPNVGAGSILLSVIAFTLIFVLLGAAMVYLFVKTAKQGPYGEQKTTTDSDPFSEGGVKHA